MSSLPEQEPGDPKDWPQENAGESNPAAIDPPAAASEPAQPWPPEPWLSPSLPADQSPSASEPPAAEPPLFQSLAQPPIRKFTRIPNFGHLAFLLLVLAPLGLLVTGMLMAIAMHEHLFGVSTAQQAVGEIHYILGSEGLLYVFTFVASLLIFPLFWHESLFAGLQWNSGTAVRLRWWLFSAAFVCFLLAVISGEFMPSPTNTPIEKVFRTPGAAWLLFAFGVTLAPFFEETLFRGFLLPSLCTAYDWITEHITGKAARPLDEHGHPQWSLNAMFVGSIATSIPFAGMHAAQTGHAIGPFLLLLGVSMVLCLVRLSTRSLASSVLVHASYNFLLFSLMLIGTGGFRHLDKM